MVKREPAGQAWPQEPELGLEQTPRTWNEAWASSPCGDVREVEFEPIAAAPRNVGAENSQTMALAIQNGAFVDQQKRPSLGRPCGHAEVNILHTHMKIPLKKAPLHLLERMQLPQSPTAPGLALVCWVGAYDLTVGSTDAAEGQQLASGSVRMLSTDPGRTNWCWTGSTVERS